jgi:hypothetical protein
LTSSTVKTVLPAPVSVPVTKKIRFIYAIKPERRRHFKHAAANGTLNNRSQICVYWDT